MQVSEATSYQQRRKSYFGLQSGLYRPILDYGPALSFRHRHKPPTGCMHVGPQDCGGQVAWDDVYALDMPFHSS